MSIAKNLNSLKQQIEDATAQAQRAINSVTLLAVSKAQKIKHIEEAFQAGQKLFGENYLSEALPKIEALKHLPIEWHFIGPIQSNKSRDIAENFDWVQSIDRMKIARRLNEQRPEGMPPLKVCLQVNLFNEETKSGTSEQELEELLSFVSECDRLSLRGLMAIPPPTDDPQIQRQQFQQIAKTFHIVKHTYPAMDTLSMGMSGDMLSAIKSGSTMVRVGTALFGQRPADWKQEIKG